MGRKAIYATQRRYQPYIDIIRRDLSLPDTLYIDFTFYPYKLKGGSAYYVRENYAEVCIQSNASHHWTISALMHELKHVEQMYNGRLKIFLNNDGTDWITTWFDVEMPWYDTTAKLKNPEIRDKYRNSPWEVEASAYEEQIERLFPNDRYAKLVASSKTIRMYKYE
jgi:hypothetical protein